MNLLAFEDRSPALCSLSAAGSMLVGPPYGWNATDSFLMRFLAPLFEDANPLWSVPQQVLRSRKQLLTISQDESNPFPNSFALVVGHFDIVPWLLGEQHRLLPWDILSGLRNLVADGALSSKKALQWGRVLIHQAGVAVLHILFSRLLAVYLVPVEVAVCG